MSSNQTHFVGCFHKSSHKCVCCFMIQSNADFIGGDAGGEVYSVEKVKGRLGLNSPIFLKAKSFAESATKSEST